MAKLKRVQFNAVNNQKEMTSESHSHRLKSLHREMGFFLIFCILIGIAGCKGGQRTESEIAPLSLATVKIQASNTPGITVTNTLPPTATITPIASFTPTVTFLPTTASSTPTLSATLPLNLLRKTPLTLMLHRDHPEFDPVPFVKRMVEIVKEHNLRVVTYQQISAEPDITVNEAGKLLIFTIDDISLQAEIHPSILQMMSILEDAGYPAVLGIVTAGASANAGTVARLKELVNQGWEAAIHTDSHTDLNALEKISPYGVRMEIRTCAEKIFQTIGVHPITVVLPYGHNIDDLKIYVREHVIWVVGISGGEKYRRTNTIYYVGRESPSGDAEHTFQIMIDRFN